jgi:sulfotransferase
MFFVSGLPRSGSTLLLNILGQNPKFHVTGTSGLIDLVQAVKTRVWELPAMKAMGDGLIDQKVSQTVRGLMEGFYSDVPADKIVIDKSRGWEGCLELLKEALGCEPLIICTVRDIREILASFEKLHRKTISSRPHPDEKATPFRAKTTEGRCANLLMVEGGVVGVPITAIKDAVQRGWRKNMLFVDYENLTRNPSAALATLYDFLGEPKFQHDFDNVQQITKEDDLIHIYKGLHDIRPKVEMSNADWKTILPKALTDSYAAEAKFWQTL